MIRERKIINAVMKVWLCTLLSGSLFYAFFDSYLSDYFSILFLGTLLSIPCLPVSYLLFKKILVATFSPGIKRLLSYILFPLCGMLCLLFLVITFKDIRLHELMRGSWRVLPYVLCGIFWFEVFCRKLLWEPGAESSSQSSQ